MATASFDQFESMQQAYTAIKDIDRIIEGDGEDKLESAWNVIREIDKKKFNDKIINDMLQSIRTALVEIYIHDVDTLNGSIGILPER